VAHPLHASAAVARLTASRRRQLHAAIARSENGVEVKARHLHYSEPPGVLPDLAAALDRAAESAGRRGAPIQAAHFAAHAVSRSETGSPELGRRLLVQAQQISTAGDYAAAAAVLVQIDPLPFDSTRFDLYVALASTAIALSDSASAARAHLDAVAERLPAGSRLQSAILDAFAEEDEVPIPELMTMARAALAVLDPADTPYSARRAVGVLLRAEVDRGMGLNADLMRDAAAALDRSDGALHETAYAQEAFFAKDLDDLDASRKGLSELVRRALARGEEGVASMLSVHAAATEILAEDYDAARAHLASAGAPSTRQDLWPMSLAAQGHLMIVNADWSGLQRMLDAQQGVRHASAVSRELYLQGLLGLAAHAREEWSLAVKHLRRAATIADDRGLVELGRRFRVDLPLIEALFYDGELDEARTRLAHVRTLLAEVDRPISQIALHRVNALDHAAAGDLDRAISEVSTSIDLAHAAGRKSDEALALLYRVRLSRRLRRSRVARSDLDRARDLAAAVGNRALEPVIERTASTMRRVRSDGALTPAEQRVLDLVRDGATNREISARLFVSVRTVESHVAAIVRKTGAGSRLKLLVRG
jgi:DNA-binding CsgD family transcriptional regulator/tetratricopeptide (TPR) repeat protein